MLCDVSNIDCDVDYDVDYDVDDDVDDRNNDDFNTQLKKLNNDHGNCDNDDDDDGIANDDLKMGLLFE